MIGGRTRGMRRLVGIGVGFDERQLHAEHAAGVVDFHRAFIKEAVAVGGC